MFIYKIHKKSKSKSHHFFHNFAESAYYVKMYLVIINRKKIKVLNTKGYIAVLLL